MTIQIRITGVTKSGSCVVEVVDNPIYRLDLPNDHWKTVSGSLAGVSATTGSWARFATLLNLIGMARLESFPVTIRKGDTGPGLSVAGGLVEWEII